MRILFLNQYFPPDPAPTGILLGEIAEAAVRAGHEVAFASSGQDYRGAKRGSRLWREVRGLWTLFWTAARAGRVDAVVSATSPPLLVLPAALIAKWHGARHFHWLFDLYPDLAVVLGEMPGAASLLGGATRWAYGQADRVVVLDEDMAARVGAERMAVMPPWVLRPMLEARAAQLGTPRAAGARVWLYSGNLGRAHEWDTLLEAQRLLEAGGDSWTLVFQGAGPAWKGAQERARALGLRRCEWRPYVPEGELPASLLAAEVLVVTQRPETCGLLWPSKLALVKSLPRRILWVGPKDRAIGRELSQLAHAGVFEPGDAAGVARWVVEGAAPGDSFVPEDPAAVRERGLREWISMLEH